MWFPRNLPIGRKVRLVILIACGACLLVACLALFGFQLASFRKSFMSDLSGITEIIAHNSTAALTFDDRDAAQEILSALRAKPHVISASITKADGVVFAHFGREEDAATLQRYPRNNGFEFERNYLLHSQDIVQNNELIGMLYVRSDYRAVYLGLLKLYSGILALVLVVSSVVAFVISSRLQRFVSEPILDLVETARVIADKKDYSVRAKKHNSDELGVFTDAFNQMLAQIEEQDAALQCAQQTLEERVEELQREISDRKRAETDLATANTQLVESSRQAGMAEVATGVLHNVGNVLNSVNVSATLVSDRMRQSKVPNLMQASALLREHAEHLNEFMNDDPRGKLLLDYLPDLGEHLHEERSEMLKELESLTKNLDHIKDIVAMQQSYAKVSGIIEPVSIASLAEDALQIHEAALARHGVQVVREFAEAPLVSVDRHKVLQILVNLVRNAKYAMEELSRPEKRLLVKIEVEAAKTVRVTVGDNGAGIAPENMVRIFSHGFTTKSEGHGFGLHSCAIAAREMNGSLTARSDGRGRGATFVLELPIAPPVV
jgi:C4-dicarboxylate-specific signal transduction histidine kinase